MSDKNNKNYGGVLGNRDFEPVTGGEEGMPDIVVTGGEEGGTEDPEVGIDYEKLAELLTEDIADEFGPYFDELDVQLDEINHYLANEILPRLDNVYENAEDLADDLEDLSDQIEAGFDAMVDEEYIEGQHQRTRGAIRSEGDRIINYIDETLEGDDVGNDRRGFLKYLLGAGAVGALGGVGWGWANGYFWGDILDDTVEDPNEGQIVVDQTDTPTQTPEPTDRPTTVPPDNSVYTQAWDQESVSQWNNFESERVPGQIEEIYPGGNGKDEQLIIVENTAGDAYEASYQELGIDRQEEVALESSESYLEFFNLD